MELKVLHVSETARGGPATYINNVVSLLAAKPGSTLVLVPEPHAADLMIDPLLIRVFPRGRRSLGGLLSMARTAWNLTREFEPDIINAHGTFAAAICRCLFLFTKYRTRIVYTVHCWPFIREQSFVSRLIYQAVEFALSYCCAKIICVSRHQYIAGRAIGIAKGSLARIYNGVADRPPMSRKVRDDGKLNLLFVGRFDRQKGLDILLAAAAELSDRITLRIIGASVVDEDVDKKVSKNVTFLGWKSLPEIESELEACDVVVMPSRWESFGLVAVEAMRAGRPVLASRIGSLNEVVRNGVTGILFSPVTKAGLIEGIKRCFDVNLEALGRSGEIRARSMFSAENSSLRLAKVYSDIHAKNSLELVDHNLHGQNDDECLRKN